MTRTTTRFVITAAVLSLIACGGNGNGNDPTDAGVTDAGQDGGGGGGDDGGGGGGDDGGVVTAECQKAANQARIDELKNAQPVIEGKAKQGITATIEFASLADDASTTCSVDLEFKDLNGNGSLDAYENWTLTPEERASDLLTRMSESEKIGLMAHATVTDAPSFGDQSVSAGLKAMIADQGIRFGEVTAISGLLEARATWANNVQQESEKTALGIPFVLSMAPAHSEGNGRAKAAGFSLWPHELGIAASGDSTVARKFGQVVAQEYRALGIRMALSPSADLATEPRWFNSQFTFGEDAAIAGDMVAAYINGLQGDTLGSESVAAVVGHFPGAGAAKGGYDGRLEEGEYLTYPGDNIDAHLSTFAAAIGANVQGVMPAYGVPESGDWSGLNGLVDGTTIEQVGASFNRTLLTSVLREHYAFGGLVLAPWGILDEPGASTLGAPWGLEDKTPSERVASAVAAGVDQFGGLNDTSPIADAKTAGLLTDAQIDAAAEHALVLMFGLGLFEDPYVDPAKAPMYVNTDDSYRAGLDAMNRSMVLVVNEDKPAGWLNGDGDGTQLGDKGNAGNGTGKVLPAPPGEPYVSAGCAYYIMGDFDLDYVRSVSAGYGELTNDLPNMTPAERIAYSDYVFIRIAAPYSVDPQSGSLSYCTDSLEYASNDNAAALDDLAFARNAIDAAGSKTQIIVGIDSGRPSVVSEVLSYGVSGLYVDWGVSDKVFLDVAFGIVNGPGVLPVGLPLSNAAVEASKEDVAGDGQDPTFVEGYGFETKAY